MEVPENVDEQQAYENWGYVQEGMNPYVNNPNYASNNPNYASHVEEEQQNYISNEPESNYDMNYYDVGTGEFYEENNDFNEDSKDLELKNFQLPLPDSFIDVKDIKTEALDEDMVEESEENIEESKGKVYTCPFCKTFKTLGNIQI